LGVFRPVAKNWKMITAVTSLRYILFALLFANGSVCAQGKAQYRSPNNVDLPPPGQRKVIGTWLTSSISGSCTRSFEKVNSKVYDVMRCSDGSGGDTGRLLTQSSPTKFLSRTSTAGDHYVILKNGNLSIRDKDGEIGIEPKHVDLWPKAASKPPKSQQTEDPKTAGLACFDIGYRYGHTATAAMKGKRVNPSWDFAVPDRCKNELATKNGIRAGTSAAW
jgi:hypothetical protein